MPMLSCFEESGLLIDLGVADVDAGAA